MRKGQQTKSQLLLSNYLVRHTQAALNSVGQLSRSPFNTVMTCVVIGIALALPLALFVLLKNVEVLSHNFQQSNQLTLYLKPEVNEAQTNDLLKILKKNPAINQVTAISPDQGLKELQEQAGIANPLSDLSGNPLPWAIVVLPATTLHTPAALTTLGNNLKQNPEVDAVQLDVVWAQRLYALVALAHRFVYALSIFLGLGVLLIVNNCIRSATQHNKKEIDVIKLIGGTHAFIRRPFLYTGMIYGLLGGIIAWQSVDLLLLWMKTPSSQLAQLYHSQFQLAEINLHETLMLLGGSIVLGFTGALVAVTRHLRAN
ncbi:MAG: permease-like cell division protein FtsX [Pseudomonadota bacterium]